jgi:hypothetical protein
MNYAARGMNPEDRGSTMKTILAAFAASALAHTAWAKPLTVPQVQEASSQTVKYDCDGDKPCPSATSTRRTSSASRS